MTQTNEFWHSIKSKISENQGGKPIKLWFEPTILMDIQNNEDGSLSFYLGVPTELHKYWISQNILMLIHDEIAKIYTHKFNIEFIITGGQTKSDEEVKVQELHQKNFIEPKFTPQTQTPKNILTKSEQLNSNYSFSSFVVGRNNEFAHAACHSVAENPSTKNYNPLFICGPTGMGKTHLINAVGNHVFKNQTNYKICYVSAERFLNECITAIRKNEMHKFRSKYRDHSNMLLMDDIQILGRTEAVQEEFFHTLNEYLETNRQVVVASDRMPRDIKGLEDRIRTRLEWGLIADIQMPDMETRVAILRYKAELNRMNLTKEVIHHLARISKRSIRELEGNLNKIRIYSELNRVPINLSLCERVLASHKEKDNIDIEDIQKMACDHFNIRLNDLKSKSRLKPIVLARQVSMYLIKKHLDRSLVDIGQSFGGKDHTTVLNAVRKIQNQHTTNSELSKDIEDLEQRIHNITGV